MGKKNSKDFFWTGYVDVMTNLFAITLVLFVVSFFLFKKKNDALSVLEEEYRRIRDMKEALQSLDNNKYFEYNREYQKHILTIPFEYIRDQYAIPSGLRNPEVVVQIADVGKSIIKTILQLKAQYVDNNNNAFKIKFLIVIEGQASKSGIEEYNDVLSFHRALYLKKYWLDPENNVTYNGKSFSSPELQCEMIVSGSGFSGSPREPDFIHGHVNPANQRFLVHVVPVIDWESK